MSPQLKLICAPPIQALETKESMDRKNDRFVEQVSGEVIHSESHLGPNSYCTGFREIIHWIRVPRYAYRVRVKTPCTTRKTVG